MLSDALELMPHFGYEIMIRITTEESRVVMLSFIRLIIFEAEVGHRSP